MIGSEARVLIIMTGGTICMKESKDGLVPSRGFLMAGMAPRPSFNDGSESGHVRVVIDDNTQQFYRTLRTPLSRYRKHVRYAVFEFEELLDSSSINGAFLSKRFPPWCPLDEAITQITFKLPSEPTCGLSLGGYC